jgi:hypothetical protein
MRSAARFFAILGVVGAVALMMHAAPRMPALLVVLIGGWVMAPFVILALVESLAARWPAPMRTTTQAMLVVTAVISLAIYAASAFGRTEVGVPTSCSCRRCQSSSRRPRSRSPAIARSVVRRAV